IQASLYLTLTVILLSCAAGLHAASSLQFSRLSYSVAESAGAIAIPVLRLNDATAGVAVEYATADGTATNGVKYTAVSGTLVFAEGETNKTIVVPILNEGYVDGAKTFQVTLSNPTGGAVLGTIPTATVSIRDND